MRRTLFTLLGCICLTGCSMLSFQPQTVGSRAPAVAYQAYVTSLSTTNPALGDNVIALLSYSSSDLQRVQTSTWGIYQSVWGNELTVILKDGRVSKNYALKPSDIELNIWKQFNNVWLADMVTAGVNPSSAKQSYDYSVQSFIFQVIDHDYQRK